MSVPGGGAGCPCRAAGRDARAGRRFGFLRGGGCELPWAPSLLPPNSRPGGQLPGPSRWSLSLVALAGLALAGTGSGLALAGTSRWPQHRTRRVLRIPATPAQPKFPSRRRVSARFAGLRVCGFAGTPFLHNVGSRGRVPRVELLCSKRVVAPPEARWAGTRNSSGSHGLAAQQVASELHDLSTLLARFRLGARAGNDSEGGGCWSAHLASQASFKLPDLV
jgi:hypothetical protein